MRLDRDRALIWKAILDYMEYYNEQGIRRKEMTPSTRTLDLFPSKKENVNGEMVYCDEQANLFGMALFDCLIYYRIAFDMPNLPLDYGLRTEFDIFPTLNDIFEHYEKLILGGKGR